MYFAIENTLVTVSVPCQQYSKLLVDGLCWFVFAIFVRHHLCEFRMINKSVIYTNSAYYINNLTEQSSFIFRLT